MVRKEEWLMIIAEKVVNLIEKEVPNDSFEKTELLNAIKIFFDDFESKLEEKEDGDISEKYAHRASLPEDQWLTRPPGMSLVDWFYDSDGETKK